MSKESNKFCPKFVHKRMRKLQPFLVEHAFFRPNWPRFDIRGLIKVSAMF